MSSDSDVQLPRFVSDEAQMKHDNLKNRDIHAFRPISDDFFEEYNLSHFEPYFTSQPWGKHINFAEPVWYDMVKEFAANARVTNAGTLRSRVSGVNISITAAQFNDLFECAPIEGDQTISRHWATNRWAPEDKGFSLPHLKEILGFEFNSAKDCYTTQMTADHQILYRLVTNFFMPTSGHKTEPGRMQLYLFYCVHQFITLDFGFLFIHVWKDWIKYKNQIRKIPFGPFLTRIFQHSHCPTFGNSRHTPRLTIRFLELQTVKLHQGTWYTRQDYERLFGRQARQGTSTEHLIARFDEMRTRLTLLEAISVERLNPTETDAYAALKEAHGLSPPHTLFDNTPEDDETPPPSPEREDTPSPSPPREPTPTPSPESSPTPPPPPPKRSRTKIGAVKRKKKDKGTTSAMESRVEGSDDPTND